MHWFVQWRRVAGTEKAPPRCANSRGRGIKKLILMQFSAYARPLGAV